MRHLSLKSAIPICAISFGLLVSSCARDMRSDGFIPPPPPKPPIYPCGFSDCEFGVSVKENSDGTCAVTTAPSFLLQINGKGEDIDVRWKPDADAAQRYRFRIENAVVFVALDDKSRKVDVSKIFGNPTLDSDGVYHLTYFRSTAAPTVYRFTVNLYDTKSLVVRICSTDPFVANG